jgi:hypothetical protein
VLTGLIFKAFKTKNIVSFVVPSISGALLNTLLFVGGLIVLFSSTEYISGLITSMGGGNIFTFFIVFVGINGLIEAVSCAVIGTAISKAVYALNSKKTK